MSVRSRKRCLEYERGINYLHRLSMQSPDKSYPLKAFYPKNLMVEITNACNLRCVMCYNRKMKRKRGFMRMTTYKQVLQNAKEIGIEMVGLYTTGESFLHPKIFDFIKLANEMGFKYVYITTNGLPLNKEKIKKIFESGLDSIKFSIDAASKRTYEKLKPGGNFARLLSNIKMVRKMRDKRGSKLKIYASFVLTNKNYHELRKFKKLWENLIDEILITIIGNQSNLQTKEFNKLVPKKLAKKIVAYLSQYGKGKKKYCNLLWNRIIVTYDGKFTICPEDFEAELVYGDIHKESMKTAWNNRKMKSFRKMFKTGDFNLSPRCKTCNTDMELEEIWEEL